METANILFAWVWILAGLVSGAMIGMGFQGETWLGGYASWRRRLMRLGHFAFFGTALLNLAFAFTVSHLSLENAGLVWPSRLLIAGAASMSPVCFLAAWHKPFRHLFFIPVICLLAGVAVFLAMAAAGTGRAMP